MNLVKIQRVLDRSGGNVLANILSPFKSRKKNDNPQKILVVCLWGIGDAVLTLPLIREVRKRFPEAQLDILATKRVDKVYTFNEDVNNILLLEDKNNFKKRRQYDLVFDTEQYLNSSAIASFFLGKETIGYSHGQRSKLYTHKVDYNDKQHMVHTYTDLLRVLFPETENPKKLVKLSYWDEDKEQVIKVLRDNGIGENDFLIGFCVSAAESAPSRRWAKEKFARLADLLIEKYDAKIVIVSGPGDYEINQGVFELINNKENVLNIAKEMDVHRTFAVIDQCKIFVSNDTGPMHIGAAQGVPTVGIFGPNTPVRYGPYGSKNAAVYKPVFEEPCINVHKGIVPDCHDHPHLSKIEVEDVFEAVERVMNKK